MPRKINQSLKNKKKCIHRHKSLIQSLGFSCKPVQTLVLEVNQNRPDYYLFNTDIVLRVSANSNDPSCIKPFYEDKKDAVSV